MQMRQTQKARNIFAFMVPMTVVAFLAAWLSTRHGGVPLFKLDTFNVYDGVSSVLVFIC